jgi:hypothetical protein
VECALPGLGSAFVVTDSAHRCRPPTSSPLPLTPPPPPRRPLAFARSLRAAAVLAVVRGGDVPRIGRAAAGDGRVQCHQPRLPGRRGARPQRAHLPGRRAARGRHVLLRAHVSPRRRAWGRGEGNTGDDAAGRACGPPSQSPCVTVRLRGRSSSSASSSQVGRRARARQLCAPRGGQGGARLRQPGERCGGGSGGRESGGRKSEEEEEESEEEEERAAAASEEMTGGGMWCRSTVRAAGKGRSRP